jgi:hypothetical protein
VREPVIVKSSASPTGITGAVDNVGDGGALLFLNTNVPLGSGVRLSFNLPAETGDSYCFMSCRGRVVRVASGAARHAVAVAFE